MLLKLPHEVLVNVIINLNLSDIRNLMLTCRILRNLIKNDNAIWRYVCRNKLLIRNRSANTQSISLYDHYKISHNWCSGFYKSKVIIQHHTNYMPWLKFYNSQALILSVGSELRCYMTHKRGFPTRRDLLWTLDVPKVQRNDVRTNDISKFVIKNNFIVCGNRDGCVAVYKCSENITEKPTLFHHFRDCIENGQVEVSATELIKRLDMTYIVVASNYTPVLRLICLKKEMNNLHDNGLSSDSIKDITLPSNVGIRCLAANHMGDNLAIGLDGNSKPILLDVTTNKLLLTEDTKTRKEVVRDIQWHNENVITFVTHSGMLQSLDTRTNELVCDTMDPFQSTLYCVKTDREHTVIVGTSEYSRCVLFDLRKCLRHVQMYFTHKRASPIYSLDFDSSKLFAAADRSVAALHFDVDPFAVGVRDYSHTFEIIKR